MGAARRKRARWRTLKSKRRSQKFSKRSVALHPKTMDDAEYAEVEETDRLVLSSLRFWEVERDLIEERMAVRGR